MKFILNKEKWKLNENLSAARKILKDNSIPETDETFVKLRSDLKNNTGYLGWFTKMIYVNKVGNADINQILNLIHNDKYVIDNLPKNLIKYTNWENLMDDIISVQYNRSIKKMINELPSNLKHGIDINKLSSNDKELFSSLFKRKDKELFLNKVSRYGTYKEFINALKLFLSGDGAKNFDDILKSISDVESPIIHKDKENNLIICEVNYRQIKRLGSDTSWCIVPSKGTFNSYVNGIYKQYIIFLTDLETVYSKIGVTAAFDTKNIHLKNDGYLSKEKLTKLLAKRDYDIKDMLFNIDDFLATRDINKIKVNVLKNECKLSLEDILKRKKIFTKEDLGFFTDKQIKEYDLNNKLIIKSFNDFKEVFKDSYSLSNDLIDNIERMDFKLSFKDLIELRPMPKYLEVISPIVYGQYGKEHEGIKNLIEIRNKPELLLKKINNFKSYYNRWIDWRGDEKYNDEDGSGYLIYAMMVAGVYPQTVTKKEIIKAGISFRRCYSTLDLLKHLKLNGYDFTGEDIFEIFKNMRPYSSFGTESQEWLDVLEQYPSAAPFVREIIIKGISYVSFYDSELKVIKEVYPDLYEDAKYNSALFKQYNDFKRINIYSNYMKSEQYVKNILSKDKLTLNEWLTNLYDKYFNDKGDGLLKGYTKFGSNEVYFIIIILNKLNKLNELQDFKIKWESSDSSGCNNLDAMVRICLDSYKKKLPLDAKELELSTKDKDNILETLVKMDYNFDIIIKHEAFAPYYYINNWGFEIFMRVVKSRTDKVERTFYEYEDGKHILKRAMVVDVRIRYLSEILRYLILKDEMKKAMSIVDDAMSWDMSEDEKDKSISYLNYQYNYTGESNDLTSKWSKMIDVFYPEKNKK